MRLQKTGLMILSSFALTLAAPAFADEGAGFGQIFVSFFGSESSQRKNKTCDGDANDPNGGLMGGVNSFFCHMEKDMGITGPTTGVTKTFDNFVVHVEVAGTAGGGSYAGYDYEGKVWVCSTTMSACTAANQFGRAVYLKWSYKSDKTINKGIMIQDPSAFSGSSGSAFYLAYDVGTTSATQTITAKIVADGLEMRADASKTGSVMTANMVFVNGTPASASNAFRFAAAIDTSTDKTMAYFEGPAAQAPTTISLNAASDSPTGVCLSRVESGVDFAYTMGGSCGSLTLSAFSADSATAVGNYSPATLTSTWTAPMAANPTSI